MAGIGEFFQNLIGGQAAPEVELAPPPASYPTSQDALEARKYGFGYGSGNEPYIQGDVARIFGHTRSATGEFVPESGQGFPVRTLSSATDNPLYSGNVDLRTPAAAPIKETMGTALAQAALAANRSPVAALGFDPSRATFDVEIQNPTTRGAYSPSGDSIYSTLPGPQPSNIVHESIHRGLQELRKDPKLNGPFGLFSRLPDEEMIVRYLIAKQAGDPEKGIGGEGEKQRADALRVMESGAYGRALQELNQAAANAYAARRPGGPR